MIILGIVRQDYSLTIAYFIFQRASRELAGITGINYADVTFSNSPSPACDVYKKL